MFEVVCSCLPTTSEGRTDTNPVVAVVAPIRIFPVVCADDIILKVPVVLEVKKFKLAVVALLCIANVPARLPVKVSDPTIWVFSLPVLALYVNGPVTLSINRVFPVEVVVLLNGM